MNHISVKVRRVEGARADKSWRAVVVALVCVAWAASASAQEGAEPARGDAKGGVGAAAEPTSKRIGGIEAVDIPIATTLTLAQAIERGRQANANLLVARNRLESARLLQRQAYAVLIPNISVQGIYTRYDQEITFGGADSVPPGTPPEQIPDPVVVRPLDQFQYVGKVESVFDARVFPLARNAFLAEDIAEATEKDLLREVDYAVSQLYFQLLTLEQVLEINQQALLNQQVLLEAAVARRDAGDATEFEVTRARAEVVRAEGDIERTRLSFLNARQALAGLIVVAADFGVEEPPAISAPDSLEALTRQALGERPDLERARLSLEVADNNVEAEYWKYAPALIGQFNVLGGPETAFTPAFSWNMQLILSWTLYDGGLRESQIQGAKLDRAQAEIELGQLERDVAVELAQSFDQVRSKAVQMDMGLQEVALAEEAFNQARDAYRLGALPQIELINAELALRLARIRQVTYQLEHRLAVRNIYRVAGQDALP